MTWKIAHRCEQGTLKFRFYLITLVVISIISLPALASVEAGELEDDPQLWKCLTDKVTELAQEPTILTAVNNYNSNPPDPSQMDKIWPTLDNSAEIVVKLTTTPAANVMQEWIHAISIQGEGLLIGKNGGLVASTEKTTDFWQGDEAQFLQAIILPKSEVYIQKELLDESTNMMLMKISAPVYNPRSAHPMGALVIGFDQFVLEFNQPCTAREP